ncbi:MAG: Pyrrolo-quinoline quinone beta-propeller repeat-containing protein [Gammaproteobacteria bacterium]|nr:Pyrrolo-quinoline quinone beta-propeller repeat-containing protein [Gammaproteobacteria bacterium]
MSRFAENRPTRRSGHGRRGGCPPLSAVVLLACSLTLGASQVSAAGDPLVLERSIVIPDVATGPYSDHVAIDVVGKRLFATPQAAKAVAVLDLNAGRVLKMITGIGNPHGIFYSPELKRLFVVDGASGDVKVFSGEDYALIKTIPLTTGADALDYDPHSKFLYVNNGGEDAGMDRGIVSAVDTVRMEKVADIPIATPRLESSVIDSEAQLLYVEGESEVFAVDLRTHKSTRLWKSPDTHRLKAVALDAAHARLYLVCRDSSMHGSIIALDAANGRPVATLPILGWADGVAIDKKRQRIYVSSGLGYIETYAIEAKDVYRRQPKVESDLMGKTSLYSAEVDRMYVSVPHLGDYGSAAIMVFKPSP